jgi:hypothetical protein
MKNWIWSVTLANWPTVKEKTVWAINKKGKGDMVKNGDRIVFYAIGTNYFTGGFEVVSDWHEPTPTLVWPDHTRTKQSADEINLKEIQTGWANVDKLIPLLKFWIEKGRGAKGLYLKGHSHGPANKRNPISDEDFETIIQELKNVQEEPNFSKLKSKLGAEEELIDLSDMSISESDEITPPELKSLERIYQKIDEGEYAVPDFQRDFTWKDKQIEELWESIFRSFFTGSLLHWRSLRDEFYFNPITGAPKITRKLPELVLDGQQRLTAIWFGVNSLDMNLPGKKKARKYFVNINALLDNKKPSDMVVDSYSNRQIKKKKLDDQQTQFRRLKFPISEFKDRNYTKWCRDFEDHLLEKKKMPKKEARQVSDKIEQILDQVWSDYKIPIVVLPEKLELENVVTVFERINSKGVRLGTFDLMNARFRLYDIRLQDLWRKSKEKYNYIRKWLEEDSEKLTPKLPYYILQSISLSKKGYMRKKEVLRLDDAYRTSGEVDKEEFEKDWKDASEIMDDLIRRLTSRDDEGFGIVKAKFIPYAPMIPVFSAMRKFIKERKDYAPCKKKIEHWYWNNVFSKNYGSATDTQGEDDFDDMTTWINDGGDESPFTIGSLKEIESSQPGAADYNGIMCLIAKKGAKDFLKSDPPDYSALHDHHIFPKSKAKKYGAKNGAVNMVFNRTLLFEHTNIKLGNKDPKDYLAEIMKEQNIDEKSMRNRLATHFISKEAFDCMKNNDFHGFIAARSKTIIDEIKKIVSFS